MKRAESLKMWRGIAAGSLEGNDYTPIDPLPWIRDVAKRVVAADGQLDPNNRTSALVAALGLSGTNDKYAALRRLIEDCTMFPAYDANDQEIPTTRSQLVQHIFEEGIRLKIIRGFYADDDRKGKELIRKLMPKKV